MGDEMDAALISPKGPIAAAVCEKPKPIAAVVGVPRGVPDGEGQRLAGVTSPDEDASSSTCLK